MTDIPKGADNMIRDTFIIALEASWELDPVLMEKRLWESIEKEPDEEKGARKTAVQDLKV